MSRPAVSVQLYSVRELLAASPENTLDELAELGFRAVEPFALTDGVDALARSLAYRGMTAPTAHASVLQHLDASLDAAERLGVETLVEPFQDPSRFTDRGTLQRLADDLSRAARAAERRGISVAYHNHDAELRSAIDDVPALLLLAELTDPLVRFELDVYWCTAAGEDPVAVAEALGSRLVALHIKDGDPAAGVEAQVPAGAGSVPLAPALVAAPHARPIVEFDVLPAGGLAAIGTAVAFLQTHGCQL